MNRIVCIVTAGLMVGGCASRVPAQESASLFKSKCALCHSEDGSGNSPAGKAMKAKDLRSDDTQKKSDAELTQTISAGRNKMPPFGQKLKPDQIQQLVAYIRHLPKK